MKIDYASSGACSFIIPIESVKKPGYIMILPHAAIPNRTFVHCSNSDERIYQLLPKWWWAA